MEVRQYSCVLLGYNASDCYSCILVQRFLLSLEQHLVLYRYINRQLFSTTIVVGFVLTLVMVGGRFIGYLAQAATGEISADAVFKVLALRLPEFLQMILPLALFIAILLVFGRMYVDNEMAALRAGGVGPFRDARAILVPVICMTILMALFSMWISPAGDLEAKRVFNAQASRSVLELLTPGRFLVRGDKNTYRSTYAGGVDRKAGELKDIFITETRYGDDRDSTRVLTVWADKGHVVTDENGLDYLVLNQGEQYQGKPGDANYMVMHFNQARVRIDKRQDAARPPRVRGWPVAELLSSTRPDAIAEWQWRLALIILTPLMAFLAVPMAKVNPRQGRFNRLIPALLAYLFYFGMIMTMRSWIADYNKGALPIHLNLIWVHLVALLVVVAVYLWPEWQRWWRQRRVVT
jgi:lipopolysaccharide export system permease protein